MFILNILSIHVLIWPNFFLILSWRDCNLTWNISTVMAGTQCVNKEWWSHASNFDAVVSMTLDDWQFVYVLIDIVT